MSENEVREWINVYMLANTEKDELKRNIAFTKLLPHLDKKELKELLKQSFNTKEVQ